MKKSKRAYKYAKKKAHKLIKGINDVEKLEVLVSILLALL